MGKRKFHFVAIKNSERKKYRRLVVSVPKVQLPSPSIETLHSQLLSSVSTNWTLTMSSEPDKNLILSHIVQSPDKTPIIRYSVTIKEDFSWSMNVMGRAVSQCSLIHHIPPALTSVSEVLNLISIIEKSKICFGNHEESFIQAAMRREGIFRNKDGMSIIHEKKEIFGISC